MGKFLVCVLVATAGAMVAAQPQSPYYRGSSYRGLARDITDYGLYRLMSAIQGGGRGHRELLGAASSIRNSLLPSSSGSSSYSPYQQGKHFGYLAPPPRGSKSYYYNPSGSSFRGQKPDFLKDTYIISASGGTKSKSPYSFSQAVSASGPTEYSDSEEYSPSSSSSSSSPSEYSSPGSSVYSSSPSGSSVYSSPSSGSSAYSSPTSSPYSSPSSESSSVYSSSPPPSSSGSSEYAASPSSQSSSSGPSTITVSSDEPLSLEQIVAKAAQEQHQKVLAREQQAHPGAQVTHQVRLAPQYQPSGPQPGSLPQQYRQILIQGQPGQLPPQYSPQQYPPQAQQVLVRGPPPPQFGGPNAPAPPHGQQIIIQGPNGQPMLLQLQPPQGQPQIQYVPAGPQPGPGQQIQYVQNPQQIRIAPQPVQGQQPGQPQLIQYQPIPQQGFPFGVPGQQYAGQQIYTLPGPHGFFPQQVSVAPEGLLGQPQFSLPQQEQQQIQTNQIYNQPQQQSGSGEQSASSSEQSEQIASAESSVSVSSVEAPSSGEAPLSSPGDSDPMTAALLHSHREYSEPVHKI